MAGINMPKRQQANTGSMLTLAGMGAGAALGGPAGAGIGGQLGGMAGQMQKQPEGPESVGAIGRRMAELDQSPLRQIRQSIDSLKYIQDDAQRAELAKPLLEADYMARMRGK